MKARKRPVTQLISATALALFAVSPLPAASAAGSAPAAHRPNILLIEADDLGYGDLGSYGQKLIPTPNLDRLVKEGMRFTQFYAGSAVCSASRAALMTGRHTGHTNIRGNDGTAPTGESVPVPLGSDAPTIAQVLAAAGYTTGMVGKWHLEEPENAAANPENKGFQYTATLLRNPVGQPKHPTYPPRLHLNGRYVLVPDNYNARHGIWKDDLYLRHALHFLDEHRTKPFFLFVSFTSPHEPLNYENPTAFADRGWPEKERVFAAMVKNLDDNVGLLLARLEELGLAGNTLVLFTSDNGPHLEDGHDYRFFQSNGPLRGHKRDLSEGGIRVPFLARWPGVVPAGRTSDFIGAHWDLLPTFAALADVSPPPGCDGTSILPVLRGESLQLNRALYWEIHEGYGLIRAVREGPWKLLWWIREPRAPELYNLDADLAETRDLAQEQPAILKRLLGLAEASHTPAQYFPLPSEASAP